MRAPVQRELAALAKPLGAVVNSADERLQVIMNKFMLSLILGESKSLRAEGALKGLNPRVHELVTHQGIVRGKGLGAVFARVFGELSHFFFLKLI